MWSGQCGGRRPGPFLSRWEFVFSSQNIDIKYHKTLILNVTKQLCLLQLNNVVLCLKVTPSYLSIHDQMKNKLLNWQFKAFAKPWEIYLVFIPCVAVYLVLNLTWHCFNIWLCKLKSLSPTLLSHILCMSLGIKPDRSQSFFIFVPQENLTAELARLGQVFLEKTFVRHTLCHVFVVNKGAEALRQMYFVHSGHVLVSVCAALWRIYIVYCIVDESRSVCVLRTMNVYCNVFYALYNYCVNLENTADISFKLSIYGEHILVSKKHILVSALLWRTMLLGMICSTAPTSPASATTSSNLDFQQPAEWNLPV